MSDGSAGSQLSAAGPDDLAAAPARLLSGLRIVSLLTLLSRVLGLVRDMGMAALFGNGIAMDAFSVAFRVPNLARRLFGEGALTAAFLPVFLRELKQAGIASAWNLASATLTVLAVTLAALVLLGELALWIASRAWPMGAEAELLVGLTAVLLPYLIFICLAAQISAVLHAFGHFTWPALLPVLLNVVWIAAIWGVAPRFETKTEQIYVVAACVAAAGLLQLAAPFPRLLSFGFRVEAGWTSARPKIAEIGTAMLPIVVGLSITQLNTISDSLIAWAFSQPESGPTQMGLPGGPSYPLQAGAASALYFGQRMYQFPLGVFGVALGTVLFPLLSQNAERGDLDRLCRNLSFGLRLVLAIGLPASAGLMLLARPLTQLLFQRGAFNAADARQTAAVIVAYGCAVWAYCGLLIVHRGYYAVGDRQTPMHIGLLAVAVNLTLNFTLIWFLGGPGLALATAIAAIVQVATISVFIQRRIGRLDWPALWKTSWRSAAATIAMGCVCLIALERMPAGEGLGSRLAAVFGPLSASLITYFVAARLLGLHEVGMLLRRPLADEPADS